MSTDESKTRSTASVMPQSTILLTRARPPILRPRKWLNHLCPGSETDISPASETGAPVLRRLRRKFGRSLLTPHPVKGISHTHGVLSPTLELDSVSAAHASVRVDTVAGNSECVSSCMKRRRCLTYGAQLSLQTQNSQAQGQVHLSQEAVVTPYFPLPEVDIQPVTPSQESPTVQQGQASPPEGSYQGSVPS